MAETPQTPLEIYRAIIDQLAEETRVQGAGSYLARSGRFSNAPDHEEFNTYLQALDDADRKLIAEMLESERNSAIHDALALLTWWIDCSDVTLCVHGDEMPIGQSGMGLHGDYVGRVDDWEWPSTDES